MLTLLLTTWLWVTPILHEGPSCIYYAYISANDKEFWIDQSSMGGQGCDQEWKSGDGGVLIVTTPLYIITIYMPDSDFTEGYVRYTNGQPYAEYHRIDKLAQKLRVTVQLKDEV